MKRKLDLKWILIILVVVSVLFNLFFIAKSAYLSMRQNIYNQARQQVVQGVYNTVKTQGGIDIVYNDEVLKLVLTEQANEEI